MNLSGFPGRTPPPRGGDLGLGLVWRLDLGHDPLGALFRDSIENLIDVGKEPPQIYNQTFLNGRTFGTFHVFCLQLN